MFRKQLKELLQRNGKTQKELADFIGVRQNTVSDWLNRGTSPKIEQICKISEFFSVSFDYLFAGINTPLVVNNAMIDAKEILKDKLTTDERSIINMYREIDETGKDLAQNSIREIWADHRQPKCKSTTTENKNIS